MNQSLHENIQMEVYEKRRFIFLGTGKLEVKSYVDDGRNKLLSICGKCAHYKKGCNPSIQEQSHTYLISEGGMYTLFLVENVIGKNARIPLYDCGIIQYYQEPIPSLTPEEIIAEIDMLEK